MELGENIHKLRNRKIVHERKKSKNTKSHFRKMFAFKAPYNCNVSQLKFEPLGRIVK